MPATFRGRRPIIICRTFWKSSSGRYSKGFQEVLAQAVNTDAPEDTLRAFIESSAEVDVLLQKLLRSQRREQIETILVNAVRSYLQDLLNRQEFQSDLSVSDAKVMLDFCAYGIVGLLLANCGKKSLDKEKMAIQMRRLILGRTDRMDKNSENA